MYCPVNRQIDRQGAGYFNGDQWLLKNLISVLNKLIYLVHIYRYGKSYVFRTPIVKSCISNKNSTINYTRRNYDILIYFNANGTKYAALLVVMRF
jgi:hypothetical protein